MAIEQTGPGDVSNSYGTRSTNTPVQMSGAGVLRKLYDGMSGAILNADGDIILQDGSVVGLSEATAESQATASSTTTILSGAGEYFAYRCTVAAGNITIYDNTTGSGKVLVPTTALTVGVFPMYGAGIGRSVIVSTGITVVLSGAATVYIGHMGY